MPEKYDQLTLHYSKVTMTALSTDWLFRFLLHEWTRRLFALGIAVLTWAQLAAHGWPWWAWLPAVILAMMAGYLVMILITYAYQKSTYQIRARLTKQRLHASPDDTTAIDPPASLP